MTAVEGMLQVILGLIFAGKVSYRQQNSLEHIAVLSGSILCCLVSKHFKLLKLDTLEAA
jgi:hypothetical protein